MGNITNIFYGPGQVTLYDGTNSFMSLGYLEAEGAISITEDTIAHSMIDGRKYEYGKRTKVKITLIETEPGLLLDLETRKTLAQEIWIAGLGKVIKLTNQYINLEREYNFETGELLRFIITAQTEDPAQIEEFVNLLSSVKSAWDYGSCEVDTNADGLCDGWVQSGLTCTKYSTWKEGGSYSQRLVADGVHTDYAYIRIKCPIDGSSPWKITASAQFKNVSGSSGRFTFGIRTVDYTGTVITSWTTERLMTGGEESNLEQSSIISEASNIGYLDFFIQTFNVAPYNAIDIAIDNCQIQMGPKTSYTEND